jgi:hypothetical protein
MRRGFWKSLISDERGEVSSKRIIAITCVLALCVILFYPFWFNDARTPSEFVVDALKYIGCVSLGSTTADKFSLKNIESNNIPPQ